MTTRKFGWLPQPETMTLKLGSLHKTIDAKSMLSVGSGSYPETASLDRHLRDIVFDQGNRASCVAVSLASGIIVLQSVLYPKKQVVIPSHPAIYYWARETHGAQSIDMGTYISAALEAMSVLGIPELSEWTEMEMVDRKPGWSTYVDAADRRWQKGYRRIFSHGEDLVNDMKYCVGTLQRPVEFGMDVTSTFSDIDSWDVWERKGHSLGGHAMLIIGYDKESVHVINSHGRSFGVDGRFRMGLETVGRHVKEATVMEIVPEFD